MAFKKYFSNKNKPGWRWDPNKKQFWSWGFDIRLKDNRRLRENGFATKQLAEAAVGRLRLSEKSKRYELTDSALFPTVKELFDARIKTAAESGEKLRLKRIKRIFLEALRKNRTPNPTIDQLTPVLINLYTEKRQADGVKDETINRDLRSFRATLNQAKFLFALPDHFIPSMVRYIKTPKTKRGRLVSSIEVGAILFHLLKPQQTEESEDVYFSRRRTGLLFLLAAVTAARPGELVSIKESDILEDIQALKIFGKKTRYQKAQTVRYFPLLDIVRRIINEAVQIKASIEFIFTHNGTLTPTYYDHIKTACKAAGVAYGRDVPGGFIPYDLRHTGTTLMVHAGADFETITSVSGQSRYTLWSYLHASRESIQRAASALENFAEKALGNSELGHRLDTKKEPKALKAAE